jgi:peptidyl-prolyl cis-trans isomerase C
MHLRKCLILFFLVSILSTMHPESGFSTENEDLKQKIASVNGTVISLKDFKWAYDSEEQRMICGGQRLEEADVRNLKKQVFDNLIHREILYQQSRKKNIEISQARVDEEYKRIQDTMMSDIDYETIKKELGMNEQDIKTEFKRVFAINDLLERELKKDNSVTETEIKSFYDQNPDKFIVPGPARISHILIKVEKDASETRKTEARKKIEVIRDKLKKGEDFAMLADNYSEDRSSRGGDIGYIKIGQTVKNFEKAAFALEQGEISDIVETEYGYHLIKVLEKRPETVFLYENVKDDIENYLKQEKAQKLEKAYVQELLKTSKIEIYEDPATLNWKKQKP